MLIKSIPVVLLTALLSLTSLPALAEPASTASIERLLELEEIKQANDLLIEQTMAVAHDAVDSLPVPATDDPRYATARKTFEQALAETVREELAWDKVKPEWVRLYAETFDQKEIDEMIAFRQSDFGRRQVAQSYAIQQKYGETILPQFTARLAKRQQALLQQFLQNVQDEEAKTPLSTSTEPASIASIERLLELEEVKKANDLLIEQTLAAMLSAVDMLPSLQNNPRYAPARKKLEQSTAQAVREELAWDKVKPEWVHLYAEIFNQKEADTLIAFYQTDLGRNLVSKNYVLQQKTNAVMLPQSTARLYERQKAIFHQFRQDLQGEETNKK